MEEILMKRSGVFKFIFQNKIKVIDYFKKKKNEAKEHTTVE